MTSRSGPRRRPWIVLALLVTLGAVTYLVSAALFAGSIRSSSTTTPEVPADGVAVRILPQTITTTTYTLASQVTVTPGSDFVDAYGRMTRPLLVRIEPARSGGVILLAKGTQPRTEFDVQLPLDGDNAAYPFDRYSITLLMSAQPTDELAPYVRTVLVGMDTAQGLGGWSLEAASIDDNVEGGVLGQQVSIARAGSTMTISLLILSLMVVLAAVTVAVETAIVVGHRPLTWGTAGWFTGLIFALVTLRNFLPGQPPIGVWIDFLVFFWVEVTLMVVLVVHATGWLLRRDIADLPWSPDQAGSSQPPRSRRRGPSPGAASPGAATHHWHRLVRRHSARSSERSRAG